MYRRRFILMARLRDEVSTRFASHPDEFDRAA
jgi:hypothetical protein